MQVLKRLSILSAVALSLGLTAASSAAQTDKSLSPVELYKRCYIRMVREVPVASDPLLKSVIAGTRTGEAACLALFDKAQFVAVDKTPETSYVLKTRDDETSIRVLKTFNDLHISWFSNRTHSFDLGASSLVHDIEEPALYYTRAAFGPGVKFSSIVTHNQSLAGVRDQISTDPVSNYLAQRNYSHPSGFPYSSFKYMVFAANERVKNKSNRLTAIRKGFAMDDNDLVESGRLKGVKTAPNITLGNFVMTSGAESDQAILDQGLLGKTNVNQHWGSGIVGSQGFQMANANLTQNVFTLGVDRINRRTTSKMYEDLLCLQLPTLLDADVAGELIPTSSHTFQQSTSCMRCHSSVDDTAYTMRNLVIFKSSANADAETQVDGRPMAGVTSLPVVTNSQTWSLQPPKGRLHYRENITGREVIAPLNSIADIGTEFAKGSDIYNCAAKKYYRFFTGIDVTLTEKAKADTIDDYHQKLVLQLGAQLKTTQSVRTLIDAIIKSEPFHNRNYMTEAAQ